MKEKCRNFVTFSCRFFIPVSLADINCNLLHCNLYNCEINIFYFRDRKCLGSVKIYAFLEIIFRHWKIIDNRGKARKMRKLYCRLENPSFYMCHSPTEVNRWQSSLRYFEQTFFSELDIRFKPGACASSIFDPVAVHRSMNDDAG